ncbi:MAG: cupredoxin domain-containing protein [Chloroflexi bacterium]|nr:cupredoxin domain-containing protein [Chloroflexota bacterium]
MHLRNPGPRSVAALAALVLAGCATPTASPTSTPTAPAAAPTAPPTAGPTRAPVAASPAAGPLASPVAAASPSPGTLALGTLQLGSLAFNNRGLENATGKDELELEADDFYFRPTFIRGRPGQKLKLEIENEGRVQHNFSLEAQRIDQNIAPDGKLEVEVTFPASGALRFYCKFHAGQGMNAELLAGDAQPQPVPATQGGQAGY